VAGSFWLPDVHVEALTGGSAVLAAIMLKLGGLWFLAGFMPIAPDAVREWRLHDYFITDCRHLCRFGDGSKDMKSFGRLFIRCSYGFCHPWVLHFNDLGVSGGLVQMIAHGFVSAAMFLSIGACTTGSLREIAAMVAWSIRCQNFVHLLCCFPMVNCGLPGTADL
jgi:NADH-quinone oxidoreductase subunit M